MNAICDCPNIELEISNIRQICQISRQNFLISRQNFSISRQNLTPGPTAGRRKLHRLFAEDGGLESCRQVGRFFKLSAKNVL